MRIWMVFLGLGLLCEPALAARTQSRVPAATKAVTRSTPPQAAKPTAYRVRSVAAPSSGKARSVRSAGKKAITGHRFTASSGRGFGKSRFVARANAAPFVRSVGWSSGLPPAAGVQADACPSGTMATLARGHDDVVRCMPI